MTTRTMDINEFIEALRHLSDDYEVEHTTDDEANESTDEAPVDEPQQFVNLPLALSYMLYNSYRKRDYSTAINIIDLALQYDLQLPRLSDVK